MFAKHCKTLQDTAKYFNAPGLLSEVWQLLFLAMQFDPGVLPVRWAVA